MDSNGGLDGRGTREPSWNRNGGPKSRLEAGTSIVAVHACGVRTDACIDVALATGGHVAVMPCCYNKNGPGPEGLGHALATDVHRTYRLEAAGYWVPSSLIPEVITPMNRVLVALSRHGGE